MNNTFEQSGNIKEKVELVEDLPLGVVHQANILLILLGIKPAADISIFPWNNISDEEFEKNMEMIGLSFIKRNIPIQQETRSEYSVAQNQSIAKKLSELLPNRDHKEYGRLMGYPETAIDAFLVGTSYIDPTRTFLSFAFSPEFYSQEKQTILNWYDAIRQYSPKIYKKLGLE